MSRKDYVALANALSWALRDADDGEHRKGVEKATRAVADTLRRTQPNFNHARFLKACGLED